MSERIMDRIEYWGEKRRSRFLMWVADTVVGALGVAAMSVTLTRVIGGALVDRALHPADTYRDIRQRRHVQR